MSKYITVRLNFMLHVQDFSFKKQLYEWYNDTLQCFAILHKYDENHQNGYKTWRVLQKYGANYSRNITKLVGCYLKKIFP
jgi:hypothetical protein